MKEESFFLVILFRFYLEVSRGQMLLRDCNSSSSSLFIIIKYILTCILHECTQEFVLNYQSCFAIPPAVSFLISLSCSCLLPFPYTVLSLSVLSYTTHIRLSPGSAKKGSYVQRWQELISNFLHNDCIISSDSGNLAYITEAARGCRSG